MLMISLKLCPGEPEGGVGNAQLCSVFPGPGDWRQPEDGFKLMG